MSAIEYYHVELDTHEVIYAEGALVESFFDDGSNRENFSNFVQYKRLYGVERKSKMTPFAPILRYRGRRQELNGTCKVSNLQRCRRPRSDPNCLRPACPAGGSDAGLTGGRTNPAKWPRLSRASHREPIDCDAKSTVATRGVNGTGARYRQFIREATRPKLPSGLLSFSIPTGSGSSRISVIRSDRTKMTELIFKSAHAFWPSGEWRVSSNKAQTVLIADCNVGTHVRPELRLLLRHPCQADA